MNLEDKGAARRYFLLQMPVNERNTCHNFSNKWSWCARRRHFIKEMHAPTGTRNLCSTAKHTRSGLDVLPLTQRPFSVEKYERALNLALYISS
ncbi:hypothetical protein E2C01_047044 [Portunus trituberculatus]|uniref:Uncharacterized protein n=1 Tax=Portunus trituberculatus TaxID=210409 RepID=A0A5B7G7Q7_PORTR|nr:hypothetical protein [Portunus trituberculatus]